MDCFVARAPRNDGFSRSLTQDNAGRACATGRAFGPHRVNITLKADSTPSTAIDPAASAKKFAADAPCIDSHQPPSAINNSRALCSSTGPITLAAPWEEKYIDIASPKPSKVYISTAEHGPLACFNLWGQPPHVIDPPII